MRDRGKLPLVLVFHGGTGGPEAIAQRCSMHRIAEREGFVVAYPAGTKVVSPTGAKPAGTKETSGLNWSPSGKGEARKKGDVRFVRDLISDLREHHDIDSNRIFVAGFSSGGSLVYELACLLSDRIAAAAVVSGAMITSNCTPTQPVSLIHIHGTEDRRMPLEGGRGSGTPEINAWPPVRAGIDRWREINNCTGKPHVVRQGLEGVTGYRYVGTADVELWLIEGGHHAWPGGKRDPGSAEDEPEPGGGFSASEKIWSFFAAHPRAKPVFAPPAGFVWRRPAPSVTTRRS